MVPGLVWQLSFRFGDGSYGSLFGLVPGVSGRELGLLRQDLPVGVSLLELARLPDQLPRLSPCFFRRSVSSSKQARRKEGFVPEQNGERDERNGVQVECFHFSVRVLSSPSPSPGGTGGYIPLFAVFFLSFPSFCSPPSFPILCVGMHTGRLCLPFVVPVHGCRFTVSGFFQRTYVIL